MKNKRFNGFMFHTKDYLDYERHKYQRYNLNEHPTNKSIIVFKIYCVNTGKVEYFYGAKEEIKKLSVKGFKRVSFKGELIRKLATSKIGDKFSVNQNEYILKGKRYFD